MGYIINNKKNNPCYMCPDRVADPNCHGTCEKHLEWKRQYEKEKMAKKTSGTFCLLYCRTTDSLFSEAKKEVEQMTNKKIGNSFESEFCEMLSERGFWAHNLAQNASGQPADVIAARNKKAVLVDCKVCSTVKGFSLRRVEDNQILSMQLWSECGNGSGWFAFKLPNQMIYMMPLVTVLAYRAQQSYLSPDEIFSNGKPFERWVKDCR